MELGEKLSLLRKQRGMTQMELAEALDISRQAVSRWEQGVSEPSTANLIRLGQLFGVPVDALVNGDAQSPPEAEAQAEKTDPEEAVPKEDDEEEAKPEEAAPEEAEAPPPVIPPRPRRRLAAAVCAGVVCALLIGIAALLQGHSLEQRSEQEKQVGQEEVDQSLINEPGIGQPLQPESHSDLLRPGRVLIDASESCTSSEPFCFSDTCQPEDGKSLSIRIENTGNTDFDFHYSLNGGTVTENKPVIPEDPVFQRLVNCNTGKGLRFSFSIQITPRRSGETANFDITICQG